jgi:hypothetical protein
MGGEVLFVDAGSGWPGGATAQASNGKGALFVPGPLDLEARMRVELEASTRLVNDIEIATVLR